jgi:hypothetical protein
MLKIFLFEELNPKAKQAAQRVRRMYSFAEDTIGYIRIGTDKILHQIRTDASMMALLNSIWIRGI